MAFWRAVGVRVLLCVMSVVPFCLEITTVHSQTLTCALRRCFLWDLIAEGSTTTYKVGIANILDGRVPRPLCFLW